MVLRIISQGRRFETWRVGYVEIGPNLFHLTFIMYNADRYKCKLPIERKEKEKNRAKKVLLGISSSHYKQMPPRGQINYFFVSGHSSLKDLQRPALRTL